MLCDNRYTVALDLNSWLIWIRRTLQHYFQITDLEIAELY
jgi:hypothetical protein